MVDNKSKRLKRIIEETTKNEINEYFLEPPYSIGVFSCGGNADQSGDSKDSKQAASAKIIETTDSEISKIIEDETNRGIINTNYANIGYGKHRDNPLNVLTFIESIASGNNI